MKRRKENENEVIMDMELKALAKAFVESAVKKGYTASKIYATTQKVWRECMAERIIFMNLPKETGEELEFRRKVEIFVENNPSIKYQFYPNVKYEEDGEIKNTNATIEVLCEMHKVYLKDEDENVSTQNLKKMVITRLKAIEPDYPARVATDKAYDYITSFFRHVIDTNWWNGLAEFCSPYKCRRNSIAEYILTMEWYINYNK